MFIRKLYYLREVMKNQWLSLEKMKRLQEKKLKTIIKYAYRNIPFYHKTFRSLNLRPSDIKSLEDLSKIPIIDKDIAIQNNRQMISKKSEIFETALTTGTTGNILKVYRDSRFDDYYQAIRLRLLFDCGYKPLENLVFLSPLEKKSKGNLIKHGTIFKMTYISSKLPTKDQIELIEKINPSGIISLVSDVLYLALSNIELKVQPKFVSVAGEVLSKKTRRILQDYFNTRIFERYGCEEARVFAWECRYGGFHLSNDFVITEFLNNDFNYDPMRGRIIITTLENFKMPFIRYNLDDVLTLRNDYCVCGRKLPLIKEIEGKFKSFIVLKNSDLISPRQLTVILENIFGNITEFKVIRDGGKIKLLIKKDYSSINIKREIKSLIKDFPDFDIEYVDELKREMKVSPIVSKD